MKTISEKKQFKDYRYKARINDFTDFLVDELEFTQMQDENFHNLNKYKKWIIEYRKYIEITIVDESYINDEHCVKIECYEMDDLSFSFTLNLYKGSHTQYINNKNIMRAVTLF